MRTSLMFLFHLKKPAAEFLIKAYLWRNTVQNLKVVILIAKLNHYWMKMMAKCKLAPSDYHLFSPLGCAFSEKHFIFRRMWKVAQWVVSLTRRTNCQGIHKLPQLEKMCSCRWSVLWIKIFYHLFTINEFFKEVWYRYTWFSSGRCN